MKKQILEAIKIGLVSNTRPPLIDNNFGQKKEDPHNTSSDQNYTKDNILRFKKKEEFN